MAAQSGTLAPTGDAEADDLLNTSGLALVLGMLLDQQISISWAFAGPLKIRSRLTDRGVEFSASAIADLPEDAVVEVFCEKPAVHRYPAVMARRAQALCAHIAEHHNDAPESIWISEPTATQLWKQITELPGFGDEKAKIFTAVLAKRFGVRPRGWKKFAGPFADDQPRTVADVDSAAAMDAVKAWKKRQRDAGKTKQD